VDLDMKCQTCLHKRGSTYYFRRRIPEELRSFFGGKTEIFFSLRTKDVRIAASKVKEHAVQCDREFEQYREQMKQACGTQIQAQRKAIGDDFIQHLCERWKFCSLTGDDWYRQQGLSDDEYDDLVQRRAEAEQTLKADLARGQVNNIVPGLQQFLMLEGIDLVPNEEKFRQLAYAFLKVVIETTQLQRERDQGNIVHNPEPVDVLNSESVSDGRNDDLNHLFKKWKTLVPERPKKTIRDVKLAVTDFQKVVGKSALQSLSRTDFIAYRDHLIAQGQYKPKTISKKLNHLHAVLEIAVDEELLLKNPVSKIKVPQPKVKKLSRVSFEIKDLKQIFSSEFYADGVRPIGGAGEAAVWMAVLALFTGARREELAQLRMQDIRKDPEYGGYLVIIDEGELNVKTENSRRRIPLHPELIRMGFTRYVTEIEQAGHNWLFPKLKVDCDGKRSGNWGKWWLRALRKNMGIADSRKVFHSFRHTFKDACREAGLREEIEDALLGHSGSGSVGRHYGNRHALKYLRDAIDQIQFEGINFPIIVPE